MRSLVEDFLIHIRHERGQSANTEATYAGLLNRFVNWAETRALRDWTQVEFNHLTSFLEHERARPLDTEPVNATRRLSSESVYLQIAALRAF
jgi:site-specific recombinase XerD